MTSTSFSTLQISQVTEPARHVEPNTAEFPRTTFVSIAYSKSFPFCQRLRAVIGQRVLAHIPSAKRNSGINCALPVNKRMRFVTKWDPKTVVDFRTDPLFLFHPEFCLL